MQRKRQQSLVIPFVVLGVCLFAFGIPYLFFMKVDDSRDDIVLAPRFTATPTPLDRIFTQQAFADLFFTDTATPVLPDTPAPTSTEALVISIPITGATATHTATPSRTPTRTLIAVFPTRTSSGGGAIIIPSATPTNPPPTNTATKPPPTNTAIIVATITSTSVVQDPPTETPVPAPTATEEPPPPTATDEPPPPTVPPEDTPTEPPTGGNGNKPGEIGLFGLILWLLAPFALILPNRLV